MYVKSIKWLDTICKEAEVEISDSEYNIVCFSQPCTYVKNQEINEPLECLNASNIMLADVNMYKVVKENAPYAYTIYGKLIHEKGIVQLGSSIMLHIDSNKIPKDIEVNSYIVFCVDRIDLW